MGEGIVQYGSKVINQLYQGASALRQANPNFPTDSIKNNSEFILIFYSERAVCNLWSTFKILLYFKCVYAQIFWAFFLSDKKSGK